MNGEDGKQSRTQLTAADRKIICELRQKHPSYSHAQVTEEASKQLEKQLAKSTVTKTLQNSEKWLTTTEQEGGQERQRKAKYEDLEKTLCSSSSRCEALRGLISMVVAHFFNRATRQQQQQCKCKGTYETGVFVSCRHHRQRLKCGST